MSAAIERLAGATRTGGAMSAGSKVVERVRRLEAEVHATFVEYLAAQEALAREGIAFDLELTPGLAAALSDFKQRRATSAARELARADWPRSERA